MKKYLLIIFALVLPAILFFPREARAMPLGTLLYRTSSDGQMYGYSGFDFIKINNGFLTHLYTGHVGIYVGKEDGVDYVVEALANGVVKTRAENFVNKKNGEVLVGAKLPINASPLMRASAVLLAKNIAITAPAYDFDFHYNSHPILPLASSDQNGMLLYTGKFGNYLAPGYQIGFIVAPKDFIEEARKHLSILDQQVDPFIEQTLGEMINEGEINRILKKLRKTYQERRDYFCKKLKVELEQYLHFNVPTGGLAIWINFNQSINLMELKRNCAKKGLFIPQTILYQTKKRKHFKISFIALSAKVRRK